MLTFDSQNLHYYNQRETWQALTWPSNNTQGLGTRLQWQTETAGTNKDFEFVGRWGLLRMLERARVEPIDSATFKLTWQASPDSRPLKALRGMKPASEPSADSASNVARTTAIKTASIARISRPIASQVTRKARSAPASSELTYPLSS